MNIKRLKIAFTNIYLIETKKGLLMIDTSYPNTYETFLKKLDKEGISLEDIKYLILTHHHDDHAGFLANMLKKHELRVFLHQKSIPHLRKGHSETRSKPVNFRIRVIFGLISKFHKFTFPRVQTFHKKTFNIIHTETSVPLSEIDSGYKIIYTPGHTEDSISLITPNGDGFVGDLLMSSWSYLGHDFRPIYVQDFAHVLEGWKKLIEAGVKKIYPAHGRSFSAKILKRKLNKYNTISNSNKEIEG